MTRIDRGTTAFLSFLIPGWGQMRRGKVKMGLAWLILVVSGYFLLLPLGLILHVVCILEAFLNK